MAKVPVQRLRTLIQKYRPDVLPPAGHSLSADDNQVLELHIKAALEATWKACGGSWEKLMALLDEELGKEAEATANWMRAAIMAANELPETRLKSMIKSYGDPDSMPRKRGAEKPDKQAYVTALVDILRAKNNNDYSRVVSLLQSETMGSANKKGFSAGFGAKK